MACCGDVPTLEAVAATQILTPDASRTYGSALVNVVDLLALQTPSEHPHGLTDIDYDEIFPPAVPCVFAFHGYQRIVHELTYKRGNHDQMHVRGFKEEGTTTTPFDMAVLNQTGSLSTCARCGDARFAAGRASRGNAGLVPRQAPGT